MRQRGRVRKIIKKEKKGEGERGNEIKNEKEIEEEEGNGQRERKQ